MPVLLLRIAAVSSVLFFGTTRYYLVLLGTSPLDKEPYLKIPGWIHFADKKVFFKDLFLTESGKLSKF